MNIWRNNGCNILIEGYYYWVLQPIGLLLATGLAFALLGFALDCIVGERAVG